MAEHRYNLWRRPDRWEPELLRRAYPHGVLALLDRFGTRLARRRPPRPLTAIATPASASAAVGELETRPHSRPLAGGTDLIALRRQGLDRSATLVDLTGCVDLDGVSETADGGLRVGAAVTLAALLRAPAIERAPAIREAVETIASPQTRELATVGGNLCQEKRCWYYRHDFTCYRRGGTTCPCYAVAGDHRHFHAAMDGGRCQAVTPSDLASVLGALDAVAVVRGPRGIRSVAVADFYRGPGEPRLDAAEIVTSIEIAGAALARRAAFEKLSLWSGGFAIVTACASVELDEAGRVHDVRVVIGGVAPVPYRAHDAERELLGRVPDAEAVAAAGRAWIGRGHPLPGNEWKLDAAAGLVERSIRRAIGSGDAGA